MRNFDIQNLSLALRDCLSELRCRWVLLLLWMLRFCLSTNSSVLEKCRSSLEWTCWHSLDYCNGSANKDIFLLNFMRNENGLYRCVGTVSGLETNISDRPFWLHTYLSLPVYKCSPVDSQFVSLNYSGYLFFTRSHYVNSISLFLFPFLNNTCYMR